MRVLNLTTNEDAQFFTHQTERLEARGVETETLSVPGENQRQSVSREGTETRSVADYVRFVPTVLRHSVDGYDIVHANFGLTAPAAVAQPSLPVVVSLWGTDLLGPYGWVSRHATRFVDEVIVMSPEMADELDRDCHVIPHGVDLNQFEPAPQREAQADLGWSPSVEHVLFPYPAKRDVKDFPRAKRVVETARESLDTGVRLHKVTHVDHDRMPIYMNAADAMLLTSKREGSPNTVKEALACNLPVVATDVGDVRELLDGVKHSTVAETDDGLVAGLLDALRADERSDGRRVAREVSLAAMIDDILAVYEAALHG